MIQFKERRRGGFAWQDTVTADHTLLVPSQAFLVFFCYGSWSLIQWCQANFPIFLLRSPPEFDVCLPDTRASRSRSHWVTQPLCLAMSRKSFGLFSHIAENSALKLTAPWQLFSIPPDWPRNDQDQSIPASAPTPHCFRRPNNLVISQLLSHSTRTEIYKSGEKGHSMTMRKGHRRASHVTHCHTASD